MRVVTCIHVHDGNIVNIFFICCCFLLPTVRWEFDTDVKKTTTYDIHAATLFQQKLH